MARLYPLLPFHPDETPWSWVARMAAYHIRGTIEWFLRDLGFEPFAISMGEPDEILRLCLLAGQDADVVLRNTPTRFGVRSHRLGKEILLDSLHPWDDLRFCPACLAADDRAAEAASQANAIHRRERLAWRLRPVRRCTLHGVPLIGCKRPEADGTVGVFAHKDAGHITVRGERSVEATARPPTPLQVYVQRRIEGRPGPEWLDLQHLEQAVRVTELLGLAVEFGPHSVLNDLSDTDRDAAATTGWRYASEGNDGVLQALSILHARSGQPGPLGRRAMWQCYGALMEDLEHPGGSGPFSTVFAKHISSLT